MQPKVFEEGMNRLVEMFGEITELKAALYWDALRDLPDGGFVLAVCEAVKRCEFFPKPKLLREFASSYRLPAVAQPYNSRQVAEFTTTQVDEAKQRLADLVAGLGEEMRVAA